MCRQAKWQQHLASVITRAAGALTLAFGSDCLALALDWYGFNTREVCELGDPVLIVMRAQEGSAI